jgi:hypothetical protein
MVGRMVEDGTEFMLEIAEFEIETASFRPDPASLILQITHDSDCCSQGNLYLSSPRNARLSLCQLLSIGPLALECRRAKRVDSIPSFGLEVI